MYKWVEEASSFLIKHLAFFFIPIAVGLMSFGSLFIQNGLSLVLVIIGSACIGIYVTGAVSQKLAKKKKVKKVEYIRHSS
ncbi:CidA/LrgA family protein [Anaerobacillus sp. HL2]|nr:CidA/LrgA family protein [Anaerobacillus sp. HL2]